MRSKSLPRKSGTPSLARALVHSTCFEAALVNNSQTNSESSCLKLGVAGRGSVAEKENYALPSACSTLKMKRYPYEREKPDLQSYVHCLEQSLKRRRGV